MAAAAADGMAAAAAHAGAAVATRHAPRPRHRTFPFSQTHASPPPPAATAMPSSTSAAKMVCLLPLMPIAAGGATPVGACVDGVQVRRPQQCLPFGTVDQPVGLHPPTREVAGDQVDVIQRHGVSALLQDLLFREGCRRTSDAACEGGPAGARAGGKLVGNWWGGRAATSGANIRQRASSCVICVRLSPGCLLPLPRLPTCCTNQRAGQRQGCNVSRVHPPAHLLLRDLLQVQPRLVHNAGAQLVGETGCRTAGTTSNAAGRV